MLIPHFPVVVHFCVREKMVETAKLGSIPPLHPPSKALAGYEYDSKLKTWVWKKAIKQNPLPEFSLPDPNSLQAWLSSDWLKSQGGV